MKNKNAYIEEAFDGFISDSTKAEEIYNSVDEALQALADITQSKIVIDDNPKDQ